MKRQLLLWAALAVGSAHAALPIERWVMGNGAQIYFVHSPSLPMVDIQVDFDAGGRRDPAAQVGLARATASMVSKGLRASAGQQAWDENTIGQAWADGGAVFAVMAGSDRMSFVLRSLTRSDVLDPAVNLAARHLSHPAFPADVWKRERARWIASLEESLTQPATVANIAWSAAVFGQHPYGLKTTAKTLQAIEVKDMQAFFRQHIQTCRARVSVVGALTRDQVQQRVTQLLALLPPSQACADLPHVAEVKPLDKAQDIRIPFASAQAHVLMGQPGIKRDDPDFLTLTVGNYVLGGGGFVSRLTEQVREKRGLSYSVYSYFAPGLHAGPFAVGLQTRPDQVNEALKVAREVVQSFVQEGPTEAELQAAKDNLVGGFALRLDSNKKLLENVSNMAWHGLPLDYLDSWSSKVQALSVADIKTAFARKLQPQTMVTVVVGGAP